MHNWKDLFVFNRGERKGVIILLIIILIQFLIITFSDFLFKKNDDFLVNITIPKNIPINKPNNYKNKKITPFLFNPNTISNENIKKLGFKNWQSKMLLNYRKSGGKFLKKEDFKKLYFVNDSVYKVLKPFINIPIVKKNIINNILKENKIKAQEKSSLENLPKNNYNIKINSGTISDFKKIKGIGNVYSSRIIKYRKLLGGYVSINQLKEVYGIDTMAIETARKFIKLEKEKIKKININKAGIRVLSKHPYITWNMAKIIAKSREKKGNFKSLKDLLNRNLLNNQLYIKIAPYLEY